MQGLCHLSGSPELLVGPVVDGALLHDGYAFCSTMGHVHVGRSMAGAMYLTHLEYGRVKKLQDGSAEQLRDCAWSGQNQGMGSLDIFRILHQFDREPKRGRGCKVSIPCLHCVIPCQSEGVRTTQFQSVCVSSERKNSKRSMEVN